MNLNVPLEEQVRSTQAKVRYLDEGSFVNRRFVSAGVEHNTGRYRDHEVTIRDGRSIADHFSLDRHGFVIAAHRSKVADFHDKAGVERGYPAEAAELVRTLSGADDVVVRGWMIRTSADLSAQAGQVVGYRHQGGIQPPAGEAHVDFTQESAHRLADQVYREAFPERPAFSRFIAFSLWRAFSPPPQDCPLAVCDGRSLARDEGVRNTLHVVDALPSAEEMVAPLADDDERIAASVFRYRPGHRWWYFSNMVRDEVLLFKFYDSDHDVTWRCPHTAFWDGSLPDAKTRESIEVRSFAFFHRV